jgi:hypothetical protein
MKEQIMARRIDMRIYNLIFSLLILFSQEISGQATARITDVNFRLENNRIMVEYSLINASPGDQFTVELQFITETNQVIQPKSVSGDIGKNIQPGMGKTIRWDYVSDKLEFSGNLKAVVTASPSFTRSGGPANAMLSIMVPGLGDFFVHNSKVRPLATGIGTLGLFTFALISKAQSDKYYADYLEGKDVNNLITYYDRANHAHHRSYVASRVALAVWASDVIWVTWKGSQNVKEHRAKLQGGSVTLNYGNDGWQVGYRITF